MKINAIRPDWAAIPNKYKFYTILDGEIRIFKQEPRIKIVTTVEGDKPLYVCDEPTEPYGYMVGRANVKDTLEKRPVTSRTLRAVVQDLKDREKMGIGKYGTTVDRTDLTDADWRRNLYEELLDASMYIKRLMYFETFTHREHALMMHLYENLPSKFTRSQAADVANGMALDPTIAGRLLRNEQLFTSDGTWFTKLVI
jgi:hypothetical protein